MKKTFLYSKSLLLFSLIMGLFGLFRCAPTLPQAPTDGSLQGDASVVEKPMETTPKKEKPKEKKGKCVPNQLLKEYGKVNVTQYKKRDYDLHPPSISPDLTRVAYRIKEQFLFVRELTTMSEKSILLKPCPKQRTCGVRRIFYNPNGKSFVAAVIQQPYGRGVFGENQTYDTYNIDSFHPDGTYIDTFVYPKQKGYTSRFQGRAGIAFSAQGKQLAATLGILQHPTDSTEYVPYKHLVDLVVWDIKSQTKKFSVKVEPMAAYGDIAFSGDNRYIAVTHLQNALSIYDSRTGKRLYRYQRKIKPETAQYYWGKMFTAISFHPKDSSTIAFLSMDYCDLTIMNFKTQTIVKRLSFPFMTVQGYNLKKKCLSGVIELKLAFSPDGSWLIASYDTASELKGRDSHVDIFLWETEHYQKRWILPLPKSSFYYRPELRWSKDSQQFLASSTLRSWLFGCKK